MGKLVTNIPRTKEAFDFNIEKMEEMLENAYLSLRRSNDKPYARKTYPPSGVGYGAGQCARKWRYEFEGEFIRVDDVDALQIANMEYGTEAHERIQKLFEIAGILIEKEKLITLDDPPIKGFVDLIVEWNGKPTVGEIKTTKQEAFTLLKAADQPQDYHLMQLLIYMKVLEMDSGFILYENKNTGEFLIMPIYMNDENREIADKAFEWLSAAFANKELPKRPFTKGSKECRYCPFKTDCWKDGEGVVEIAPLQLKIAGVNETS